MGFLKSAIKLSIAGGVVYTAVDQKLFSSQEVAVASFQKIVNGIPHLNEYAEKASHVGLTKQEAVTYWNSGVKTCFATFAVLPTTAKDGFWAGVKYTKEYVKDQMKK